MKSSRPIAVNSEWEGKNLIKYVCVIVSVIKHWLASIAAAIIVIIQICKGVTHRNVRGLLMILMPAYGCFVTV